MPTEKQAKAKEEQTKAATQKPEASKTCLGASPVSFSCFLYGAYVVGRERRYIELHFFLLYAVFYSVRIVKRERITLKATLVSSSSGALLPLQ